MDDALTKLQERRRIIADGLTRLSAKIDELKAEDIELETAERVLARFSAQPTAAAAESGKPAGTPTTPNMILTLIREAVGAGKPGLEPKDMQAAIATRWWPSVKSEDVGPTAWRMWKDGRLDKDGALYKLPASNDEPVQRSVFG